MPPTDGLPHTTPGILDGMSLGMLVIMFPIGAMAAGIRPIAIGDGDGIGTILSGDGLAIHGIGIPAIGAGVITTGLGADTMADTMADGDLTIIMTADTWATTAVLVACVPDWLATAIPMVECQQVRPTAMVASQVMEHLLPTVATWATWARAAVLDMLHHAAATWARGAMVA